MPSPLRILALFSPIRSVAAVPAACGKVQVGSNPHEGRVTAACEACHQRLNHSLGAEWMGCVVDRLLECMTSMLELEDALFESCEVMEDE